MPGGLLKAAAEPNAEEAPNAAGVPN